MILKLAKKKKMHPAMKGALIGAGVGAGLGVGATHALHGFAKIILALPTAAASTVMKDSKIMEDMLRSTPKFKEQLKGAIIGAGILGGAGAGIGGTIHHYKKKQK